MARTKLNEVKGVATTIVQTAKNMTVISYQRTAVVVITPKMIKLNTGGWRTYTTKLRMNQASNQFHLGYKVFQRRGDWLVKYNDKVRPFDEDELVLRR